MLEHMPLSVITPSSNGRGSTETIAREMASLARKITAARERQGLSQQDVAHRARLSQQHISRVERGMNCNLLTLLKVCRALGITVTMDW